MTSVRYEIQIKRDQEAYVTSANVVSELARFARGRIEDSSFNRFALNGIPELPVSFLWFDFFINIKLLNTNIRLKSYFFWKKTISFFNF